MHSSVPLAPMALRAIDSPQPASAVSTITGREALQAIAGAWDALAARGDDQPFYRHQFVSLWLEHFADGAAWRILTLRDRRGRLNAVLPLVQRQTRLYGLAAVELQSASNAHSCRFDLLADDPEAAADAFIDYLCRQDDWDLLRLVDVPVDGRAHALARAAERAGLAVGRWESQCSPYIELPACWNQFSETLRPKFRANLRRRRRRLEAVGRVAVERISGGAQLADRLDSGFALEASGWKGRAGTAIRQHPATCRFYHALARDAAADGRLALWFLTLDGRPIAFQFALEQAGRLMLLKPAYDEQLADVSPGHLLMEDVLRDAIGRGLREFDFLGPDMPWKRDWARLARPHSWLYLFRGVRGKTLHRLKFQLGPSVRRLAGWSQP